MPNGNGSPGSPTGLLQHYVEEASLTARDESPDSIQSFVTLLRQRGLGLSLKPHKGGGLGSPLTGVGRSGVTGFL